MIHLVGFGPGEWERTGEDAKRLLSDDANTVIARTLRHPAARSLAEQRSVVFCDDLYETAETFSDVYDAITQRVLTAAAHGPVVYAVPGSPVVGELAVAGIRRAARSAGIDVKLYPAESFLDAVALEVGLDPLADGIKLLNGHDLPIPLVFDVPTIIGHVDFPEVLADIAALIDRVIPEETAVCVLADLGSPEQRVVWSAAAEVDADLAGVRTSLFVPACSGGLIGAVHVMDRLRRECPWDRKQTHHSLVRYLLEESHELADALAALPDHDDPDYGAYADVEEELGDVLLQVLFHARIAQETDAFDISDVAEQLRRKLVRRHPHVFGDVEAADAEAVKRNWVKIKADEKGGAVSGSTLDGIPSSLPGLHRAAEAQRRAAKVGFDWPDAEPALAKLAEEIAELTEALGDRAAMAHELGDILFSVVNVARHLDLDPEVAVRSATHRFEDRFRAMESEGPLNGLTLDQLDERWERAKSTEGGPHVY
ncbi:MAG: nucleoside triphosphate pyrophosphohydrolase [Acidimicrobiia bacterium]